MTIDTKWSKCGKEDFDLTGIHPPPRLYVTSKDGDGERRWGLIIALWHSGKVQWFNPIMRRYTRTWFWFTLIPPSSWTIDNGKLKPMKHPWHKGKQEQK